MKGRQDTDGIHEAWLINRFEHTDNPNPITQSQYCCLGEVLNIRPELIIIIQKVMLLSNQHRYGVQVEFN